ncbi:DUF2057 domain-containing protein [Vibrio sp. Of7-15]|nr:DUF2057 domain-containing protein [Vibrio sp. Of7-15]
MKILFRLPVFILSMLSVFTLRAEVLINFDRGVEVLAVGQHEYTPSILSSTADFKLNNGVNQLLIRVTALVNRNGAKEKYVSQPFVMKFTASDTELLVSAPFAIRDDRGVRKFEKQPHVLLTQSGESYSFKSEMITSKEFSLFKNYNELLGKYNQSGGVASLSVIDMGSENVQITASESPDPCGKSSGLQGDFLLMSFEGRQEFISWAVKHLHD